MGKTEREKALDSLRQAARDTRRAASDDPIDDGMRRIALSLELAELDLQREILLLRHIKDVNRRR